MMEQDYEENGMRENEECESVESVATQTDRYIARQRVASECTRRAADATCNASCRASK